jgi:preprotein translocase subunit SecA
LIKQLANWVNRFRPGVAHEPDWARYAPAVIAIRERRNALRGEPDSRIMELAAARPAGLEMFALACEALRRTVAMDPFDVQVTGALAMHDGAIAEMQTGEGKTLTAVLTVAANSLDRSGVHVWTANDYLAGRDANWMGPAYRLLGLNVASISQSSTREERRAAYRADVLYATANEIGFDFLRDQLTLSPDELVQRDFSFALIDEADSILIDEARIPLVIAGEVAAPEDLARMMARVVAGFRQHLDYSTDEYRRNVQLTDIGIAKIEAALECGSLFEARNLRVFTAAQDAVHARALLRRDVDYLVKNDGIEQIDEFKGRIAQNRRWPAGLQTAVEAKEGVPLKRQGRILGSITLQNLVSLFPRVCGMTGTAATQAQEFRQVYGLEVITIPTNRPVIRVDHPDIIYSDKLSKERAVAKEIEKVHATGRPILVGTASVEESERMSARIDRVGIPHEVLNAKHDETEAKIIAKAGEEGAVTISTNMAGRGTDIPLGGDRVRESGGLYVIGTNRHEARRIDHQLRGRAGRQGDPGSSRFFVSIEDDLMERYGIREVLGTKDVPSRAEQALSCVQRIVEGQNLEIRRALWKYEGLIEQHRKVIQERRRAALLDSNMDEVERRVTLIKIDDLWSDYLAAVGELKAGIHWESWTGKDPLHTFLTRASAIFDEMQVRLEAEIREALDSEPGAEQLEDSFDRSATWTYLVNDQPFGTLQERWSRAVRNQVRALIGD